MNGYATAADRDLFRTLDAMRLLPGPHRLVHCSRDRAWVTPWLVWVDAWCCPWSPR